MVFGHLRKGGPGVLALALPDSATAALEDVGFAEPTVEAYYCVQGVIGIASCLQSLFFTGFQQTNGGI